MVILPIMDAEIIFKKLVEIKKRPVTELDEKAFERLVGKMVVRDDGIEVV